MIRYDYERAINMMLDQLDSLRDSEVLSKNIAHYGQAEVGEAKQLPTGDGGHSDRSSSRSGGGYCLPPSASYSTRQSCRCNNAHEPLNADPTCFGSLNTCGDKVIPTRAEMS